MTDTKAEIELLPCPFDNGKAAFWEGEVAHGNYLVVCESCECQLHLGEPFEHPEDCDDEEFDRLNKIALATQWNTRTPTEPSADDRATCKTCGGGGYVAVGSPPTESGDCPSCNTQEAAYLEDLDYALIRMKSEAKKWPTSYIAIVYDAACKYRAALTQSPAPDLEKIAEKIEKLRNKSFPVTDWAKGEQFGCNSAIDAALELIKQARG